MPPPMTSNPPENSGKLQRIGGIHHALIRRQARKLDRLGAGGDDAGVEVDSLGSAATHHLDDVGADETANTLHDLDLALLGEHAQTAGQLLDDRAVLKPRNFSRSIAGLPNAMPWAPMASASSITFAACSSAFDGMQPTFRQTPPRTDQRSTNVLSCRDQRRGTQPCSHPDRSPTREAGWSG